MSHSPVSRTTKHKLLTPPGSLTKRRKAKIASTRHGAEFHTVHASVKLTIAPIFATNYREGAEEMLDSMIMRYQPTLGGVVLAHSNLRFLESAGRIKADSPYATFNVGFDATVWRPEIGMLLEGRVSLCSPDHVSLLVHRTFNVSIPRHHIPTDQWEFEYGPAENDPEFGAYTDMPLDDGAEDAEHTSRGRWIHSLTAEPLGGRKGRLTFTVVGLTIANQMISLIGSIQPDPFSPEHVARPAQERHSNSPIHAEGEPAGDDVTMEENALGESVVENEQHLTKEEKRERKRKRKEEKARNKEKELSNGKSSKRTKT